MGPNPPSWATTARLPKIKRITSLALFFWLDHKSQAFIRIAPLASWNSSRIQPPRKWEAVFSIADPSVVPPKYDDKKFEFEFQISNDHKIGHHSLVFVFELVAMDQVAAFVSGEAD